MRLFRKKYKGPSAESLALLKEHASMNVTSMFGGITDEDRARWAAKTPEEQAESRRQLFSAMAGGLQEMKKQQVQTQMQAEQYGRSMNNQGQKVTRVITEEVTSKVNERDFDIF